MKIIKRFKKSEKGSITIMVLSAMLFMLLVITASYLAISNESIGQNKKILQISKQYQVTEGEMEQEYRNVFNSVELTIQQAQSNAMFEREINTATIDDYGNKVVIPAGFKITEDTAYVTEGIVIEDAEGNQFVWVPVGTVTTTVNGVEKTETIELSRYTFDENGEEIDQEEKAIEIDDVDYQELVKSDYDNAVAKDIEAFKSSANSNGGYYLGRYEAGDSTAASDSNKITCKSGQYVYNYVTQLQASSLSQNMYDSSEFASDLINSYAWDTAIVFIQAFGEESNSSTYSRTIGLSSTSTTEPQVTGINILNETGKIDKQCNIYDMAGNCAEWSTETCSDLFCNCVLVGGSCDASIIYTSSRNYGLTSDSNSFFSFRPILYLNN